MCLAWDPLGDDANASAHLERLVAIAEELDATSFRFAAQAATAAQLAAQFKIRDAITRLEAAMPLAERASPTARLFALGNLVWYSLLCDERASLERVAQLVTRTRRDWGAMTPLASALRRLPQLLDRTVGWDGYVVPMPVGNANLVWVLA